MPAGSGLLLGAQLVGQVLAVELAVLDGADGADLGVLAARSRSELRMGWICKPEVEGRLVSSPSRRMSFFCRALVRLSWARKKTTPRWETGLGLRYLDGL